MKSEEKKEIVQTVAEAFEALILPHIDELKAGQQRLETDVAELKADIAELKTDVSHLQTGQDAIAKRQGEEQTMLDTHDRQIQDLQKQRPLAVA